MIIVNHDQQQENLTPRMWNRIPNPITQAILSHPGELGTPKKHPNQFYIIRINVE